MVAPELTSFCCVHFCAGEEKSSRRTEEEAAEAEATEMAVRVAASFILEQFKFAGPFSTFAV